MSLFNEPRSSMATSSAAGMLNNFEDPSLTEDSPWSTPAAESVKSSINRQRPTTWSSHLNSNSITASSHHLPDIYSEAWSIASNHSSSNGSNSISFDQLNSLLATSALSPDLVQHIINLSCSQDTCSQSEFNLALLLVAQAQAGQDLNVSEARSLLSNSTSTSIPIPKLSLSNLESSQQSTLPTTYSTLPRARPSKKDDSIMSDPWGGQGNATKASNPPSFPQDPSSSRNGLPQASNGMISDSTFQRKNDSSQSSKTSSKGKISKKSHSTINPIQLSSSNPNPSIILTQSSSQTGSIPFWKHNTYTLISTARGTKVENRRYSDFVFLNNFLTKKYPFRLIPSLPPKRIKVSMNLPSISLNALSNNGSVDDSSSITTSTSSEALGSNSIFQTNELFKNDEEFNKDRLKSLLRYLNIIEAHPILSKDPLVEIFFGEKKNFLDWKDKQIELDQSLNLSGINSSESSIPFLQNSLDFINKSIDQSYYENAVDYSKSPLNSTEESLRSSAFLTEYELMEIPIDFELKLTNFSMFVKESHDRLDKMVRIVANLHRNFEELSINFDGLAFCLNSLKEVERNNEEGFIDFEDGDFQDEDDDRLPQDGSRNGKRFAGNVNWSGKVSELTENLGRVFQERGERTEGNVLEGLMYQRTILKSFLDLSSRHQRLSKDHVETLRKRVDSNQSKLNSVSMEKRANYQSEELRLKKEIEKDRELIDLFLNRRNHSRFVIWNEIAYLREISTGIQEVWKSFWDDEQMVVGREHALF